MKKTIIAAIMAIATITGAQAYNFRLDITFGDMVVGNDGVTPFAGTVMLGFFAPSTNFSNSIDSLDSDFTPLVDTFISFQVDYDEDIPAGGTWGNLSSPFWNDIQTTGWDATFNGKDIVAVLLDTNPADNTLVGDLFNGATQYLIVDTGNNFQNAVASGLGTTFAALDTADTVLKASGSAAVVPEPASALLLVGGLGAMALRRRRA